MRAVMALIAMGACKGPGDSDGDTGFPWPEPKPWQVDGEQGSIVVTRLDRAENPVLDVYALFADDTQGYLTAAACAQGVMPCVREVPAFDDFVRANNEAWRPRQSDYRWVGDGIFVGATEAPLRHDLARDMAFYQGSTEAGPVGTQRVRLGGEWADIDLPLLELDGDFRVTGPLLGVDERLDLSGAEIEFTWESDGGNEVWLWFDGPSTRRLYRLVDDGSFELDPDELGLDPAEVVDVGLASARRESADIAGNHLDLVGLAGAGWTGSECGAWLDVPIVGDNPDPTPMPDPFFMGWGFRGLVDDGIHDYRDPETGAETSAALYFTFYDLDFTPMCEIRYEADLAARRAPLLVESGAAMFQAWNVALFNGESTCGAVSASLFGSSDLRDYVEQFDWSFAVGEMLDLEEPLSEAFGPGWANQSRFIYSVYWSQDGLFGDEQGYGYAYALGQTCFRGDDGQPLFSPTPPEPGVLSAVQAGMPPGFYFTFPYYVELVP